MKNTVRTALAAIAVLVGLSGPDSAEAQDAILAEMYGRGVHAYYAGNHTDAYQYLSMAIDNGIKDPRAYYFRGIVAHASGRPYEAETDWQLGAAMEAAGRANPAIGRSLARFQGSARLKLETIRQQERLKALANQLSRSKARYGELGADPGAAPAAPAPVPGAAPPAAPVAPPSPPAADDPFADDMAQGEPSVQADDALEGAMDPVAGEEPAGGLAPAAADDNPFGPDAGGGADPFGGGDTDPFGGGGDTDPFGGGGDAGGDPFGGAGEDPFGS